MFDSESAPPPDVIAALRTTRLWRDAPEETVRAAASLTRPVRFAAGDTLIRQGQPGERLLVIAAGRVEVRVRAADGPVATVAVLSEGEWVGEMSLLTGDPASADVVAAGDVEALELSAADFARVASTDPALLREFVRVLSLRLSRTDAAVGMAHEKGRHLEELLREQRQFDTEVVGRSPEVRKLRERIAALAPGEAPVLVTGDEGTGRELVARLVHAGSRRGQAPALAVDCAQIADSEWGDRLFGPRGEATGRRAPCYLDLAEGGTIILRKLEALPPAVQERLARFLDARAAGPDSVRQDVRVVATTCDDPFAEAAAGRLLPALLAAFGARRIDVPALRQRKRDIPDLAAHYLRKHAARLGKPVRDFDDQALTRLVSYNYRIANVRELEQAVERAVILAESETIAAEEVFLGPPPASRLPGIDVLRLPGMDARGIIVRLLALGRAVGVALFALILYLSFFGETTPQGNLATTLAWAVGWPVLVLSFFLAGRASCAVCPMGFAAVLGARLGASKRHVPAWIKEHDVAIAMVGFFLIVLAEETTAMRRSPQLTGLLLLTISAGAVVTGLLYPRRTWCRHVCPLGSLAGVCSTSGVVELRPTFDVCAAKCTGHACFKGDDHVPGCPMFNHLMFLESNQHCVLCMNCVRTCPNGSPQLNLRLPGRELWTDAATHPALGLFVLMLTGLLAAMTFLQDVDHAGASWLARRIEEQRFVWVGGVLALGAALPLVATWPLRRGLAAGADAQAASPFWRGVAAMTPLVTTGFVANQMAYVPGLDRLVLWLGAGPGGAEPWLSVSVLAIVRTAVLSAGLFTTAVILWQVDLRLKSAEERWRRAALLLVVTVGYWALLLGLMLTA
jgi:transcriptional regulator with AAA-type ATPase domain/polyferredoxin